MTTRFENETYVRAEEREAQERAREKRVFNEGRVDAEADWQKERKQLLTHIKNLKWFADQILDNLGGNITIDSVSDETLANVLRLGRSARDAAKGVV